MRKKHVVVKDGTKGEILTGAAQQGALGLPAGSLGAARGREMESNVEAARESSGVYARLSVSKGVGIREGASKREREREKERLVSLSVIVLKY